MPRRLKSPPDRCPLLTGGAAANTVQYVGDGLRGRGKARDRRLQQQACPGPVASLDEDGVRTACPRGFEVRFAIADHPGAREVDPMISCGASQHAGSRLSAFAINA